MCPLLGRTPASSSRSAGCGMLLRRPLGRAPGRSACERRPSGRVPHSRSPRRTSRARSAFIARRSQTRSPSSATTACWTSTWEAASLVAEPRLGTCEHSMAPPTRERPARWTTSSGSGPRRSVFGWRGADRQPTGPRVGFNRRLGPTVRGNQPPGPAVPTAGCTRLNRRVEPARELRRTQKNMSLFSEIRSERCSRQRMGA